MTTIRRVDAVCSTLGVVVVLAGAPVAAFAQEQPASFPAPPARKSPGATALYAEPYAIARPVDATTRLLGHANELRDGFYPELSSFVTGSGWASFTFQDEWSTHVEPGGRFRLKDKSLKDRGEWSWQQNPFVETSPYQGLLVILMMFNSSDLRNANNTLYEHRSPEGRQHCYVVRDLGGSLGSTGTCSRPAARQHAGEENV